MTPRREAWNVSELIFVTVGVTMPFPRLVDYVDELAGDMDERVVIQHGEPDRTLENAEGLAYCSPEEFHDYLDEAALVICHAGTGTILECLRKETRLLVVPRRQEYGEVTYDHQLKAAEMWANQANVTCAEDMEELGALLDDYESKVTVGRVPEQSGLVDTLHADLAAHVN